LGCNVGGGANDIAIISFAQDGSHDAGIAAPAEQFSLCGREEQRDFSLRKPTRF
jgi:hypothetical protein